MLPHACASSLQSRSSCCSGACISRACLLHFSPLQFRFPLQFRRWQTAIRVQILTEKFRPVLDRHCGFDSTPAMASPARESLHKTEPKFLCPNPPPNFDSLQFNSNPNSQSSGCVNYHSNFKI